jgi:cell division protein FtsW (lipid II flippase)
MGVRSAASWAFLVVAATLDYLTTRVGLAAGHPETNPLAAAAIDQFGLAGAVILLKLPAVLLVGYLWLVLPAEYRDLGVGGVALVWSAAALWNACAVTGLLG